MGKGIRFLLGATAASAVALQGEQDWSGYTYEQYAKEFGKEHHPEKEEIFKANLDLIQKHNSNPSKTWFATVNQFTDMTEAEFKKKRAHGTSSGRSVITNAQKDDAHLSTILATKSQPASLDWRTKSGVVTPVKDQGDCGSCWAFSTVETMESALSLATGKSAPILSPQQVVSCSTNPQQCGGTGGCDGSTQELGFKYTEAGLASEESYPYRGVTGTCQQSKIKAVAKNSGFVKIPSNNYTALMSAVANIGPIAISVAAGGMGWQMYGGGVFSDSCGWDQDHAVQLVGYGTDGGKDYWLVRNSWAEDWGENGYIRIQRYGEGKEPCGMDKTPQDGSACKGDTKPVRMCGLCGILSDSSYPTGMKQVGPSPGPSPSPPSPTPPGPAPGPAPGPTPGCKDTEDSDYCGYVKTQSGYCELLFDKCMKTCGCCDASPPSYCNGLDESIVV